MPWRMTLSDAAGWRLADIAPVGSLWWGDGSPLVPASLLACARLKPRELSTSDRRWSTRRCGASRMAFAWPENAPRNRGGSSAVSRRPSSALEGNGPSDGRAPTEPKASIPLHSPSNSSDQGGTSCRQSTSGRSSVASRIIRSRYNALPGGWVRPWNTFQVRISTALL